MGNHPQDYTDDPEKCYSCQILTVVFYHSVVILYECIESEISSRTTIHCTLSAITEFFTATCFGHKRPSSCFIDVVSEANLHKIHCG
jgi:hypothetical protein